MAGLAAGPCLGLMWLKSSGDNSSLLLWLPCEELEQTELQEEKMDVFLSLCQARVYQGRWHRMADVHFGFSALQALLIPVLPAVEREGEGNRLPHQPFLHQEGSVLAWGSLGGPQHGADQYPRAVGWVRAPRAWDRPALW